MIIFVLVFVFFFFNEECPSCQEVKISFQKIKLFSFNMND